MLTVENVKKDLQGIYHIKDYSVYPKLNEFVTDYGTIFKIHKAIHPRTYDKKSYSHNTPAAETLKISNEQQRQLDCLFKKYSDCKLGNVAHADEYLLNLIKKSLNTFRVIIQMG